MARACPEYGAEERAGCGTGPARAEVRNTFDLFPDGEPLLLLDRGNDQDTAIHVRSGWRPC